MEYKSAVFVVAILLSYSVYVSYGFLDPSSFLGGGGNSTGGNLSCYTCEVGVNGTTECIADPASLTGTAQSEVKNCSLTQTFCERVHDGEGVVTKRGCIELCISITAMVPIPELAGLIEMFMGGGTGCCTESLCNGAGQQVYNVFVLLASLFVGSRLVHQ